MALLHVLAKLIGRILRAHGEVGLGRDGGGTRRLNLRLRIGRNGLRRLRLGLLLDLGCCSGGGGAGGASFFICSIVCLSIRGCCGSGVTGLGGFRNGVSR